MSLFASWKTCHIFGPETFPRSLAGTGAQGTWQPRNQPLLGKIRTGIFETTIVQKFRGVLIRSVYTRGHEIIHDDMIMYIIIYEKDLSTVDLNIACRPPPN